LLLLCWATLAESDQTKCEVGSRGKSGEFDYYKFSQGWSPNLYKHINAHVGAHLLPESVHKNLTIYQLRPQYDQPDSSGCYSPLNCPGGPGYTGLDPELLADLRTYWPDQIEAGSTSAIDFEIFFAKERHWAEQWRLHGTCSGLPSANYFEAAIALNKNLPTPALLKSASKTGKVSKDELETIYNDKPCDGACWVELHCQDFKLLEIRTCWSKDFHQRICPPFAPTCPKGIDLKWNTRR